ncbi:MAG: hypothetical protein WEC59_01580 [Salibacteraceae bacterium]
MRVLVTIALCVCVFNAHSEGLNTRSENIDLEKIANKAEQLIYENPIKLDSAINELRRAAVAADDSDYIMMANLLQGISLTTKNDFAHALKRFIVVYEYGKAKNDIDFQVNALNDMGGVYMYINQHEKAKLVFRRARDLINSEEDQYLNASLNMALGMSQTKLGEFDSARVSLSFAMNWFKEQEEMHLAQSCMNEMAYGLEKQRKYRQAIDVYNSMLALYPYTDDVRGEIVTHQRKGNALMKIGHMRDAIASLESSLEIADEQEYELEKDSTLVRLIKANATIGNIASAESYAFRLIDYIEDRETKRNHEMMAYVDSKFNLHEQERINSKLAEELKATRADLSQTSLYLRFASAAVVLLILSILAMFRRLSVVGDKSSG